MTVAIALLSGLAVVAALVLGIAARRFGGNETSVVDAIDAVLPQTQCGQCGYPGCRPYATAIANDEADINQCPPGGEQTILALADLLARDPKPLDPERGEHGTAKVALIDEEVCIGCTLCIQACPVDAIVGAAKQMHTVIAAECTGCDLCLPPCPVDCIDMVEPAPTLAGWRPPQPGVDARTKAATA